MHKQIVKENSTIEELNFGLTTFDSTLESLLTIFQTVTQEGWVYVM